MDNRLENIPLIRQFKSNWKKLFPSFNPIAGQGRLLLAVSGGVDSVVLTDVINKCGFDYTIAHCNFQLRGEESERDELFVRELATKRQAPIEVIRFDTYGYAKENNIAIQEAARYLRYQWFEDILSGWKKEDPSKQYAVITAHHADDNIETLLMNFFRGTGIQGLHGILPRQGNLIRPLLFAQREQISQYATENGLQWIEDSSNASDKYTRNYFRHQVIPLLKNVFPSVESNLLHNIDRFNEVEQLYTETVIAYKKKLVEVRGNEIHIPVRKLLKTPALHTILWEIIKDFQFTALQVEEVRKLLNAENSSHVDSPAYRIIKNRDWLIIAPLKTLEADHYLVEEGNNEAVYKEGVLHLKSIVINNSEELETLLKRHIKEQATSASNNVFSQQEILVDSDKISFPLMIRKWKQGDYFYPFGMPKKKKLSRFFIDRKLSALDKENAWILESDKKIIWIIGLRMDDRFKVTNSTKNVLVIKKKQN